MQCSRWTEFFLWTGRLTYDVQMQSRSSALPKMPTKCLLHIRILDNLGIRVIHFQGHIFLGRIMEGFFSLQTFGLLICTLLSENQGLEKSRSASNHRKFSGPANLDFSRSLLIYTIKNPGDKLKWNPGVQDLTFFYGLKQTLILKTLMIFRNQGAD